MKKLLNDIREWFEHLSFIEPIQEYLSGLIDAPALSGTVLFLLTLGLATLIWKTVKTVLELPPEIEWHLLNPDNEQVMREAFDDLHVLVSLANELNENTAESLEEFIAQIRRLDRYGMHPVWSKLDPENESQLQELFSSKDVVQGIAAHLHEQQASSLEEFRRQVSSMRRRN